MQTGKGSVSTQLLYKFEKAYLTKINGYLAKGKDSLPTK